MSNMAIVPWNQELLCLEKRYERSKGLQTVSPHAFKMLRTIEGTTTGLPDTVNILICSFFNSEEIKQIRAVNQNMRRIVDNIIPKFSNMWSGTQNAFQKEFIKRYPLAIKEAREGHSWELAFMKFQDRPVWQRVGLVGLTIVLSPVIFLYNLPKMGKGGLKRVIIPLAQWTCTKLIKGAEFVAKCVKEFFVAIYKSIIKPVYNITAKILRFSYEEIFQPTGKALIETIKALDFLVRKICTYINDTAVVPATNLAKKVVHWTNENIVRPMVKMITEIGKALFITLPKNAWKYVIKPIGTAIFNVVKAIFEHIVIPVLKQLWEGVKFTYNQILTPIGRAIKTIAKGIFITIPSKVWSHVLYPVLETIWKGVKITYNHVLTPVASFVLKIAKGIFVTIPSKVFEHVLKPIGEFTWKLITLAFDNVVYPILNVIAEAIKLIFTVVIPALFNNLIIPIVKAVNFTASLLFNQVFVPLAKAVGELARVIFIEGPIMVNNVVIKPAFAVVSEVYNVVSGLVVGIAKKIFGG